MTKAILSIYYLVMKFSTDVEIGEVKGNQLIARECYFMTVKAKQKAKETFTVRSDNLIK